MPEYASSGRGGRWYTFPESVVDGGLSVPSVTTILSNGLPAPALKTWGERIVAEYAVEHHSEWLNLECADAIDLIKRAPYRTMTKAGNRGTDIHTLAEIILENRPLPDEWAGIYAKQVDAIRAWISDYNVRPIAWERTVGNAEIGYAGTYDLYGEVDGTLSIVDWKTSKGVYGKMGLQLAAYARAEWELDDTGRAAPMPKVSHAGIVHILPDGDYHYRPVVQELDDLYDTFAHVAQVARFVIDGEREVLGRHLPPFLPVLRADVVDRVQALIDQEHGAELAANWPVDIPTLKSEHRHTRHELDAIEFLLRRIEGRYPSTPEYATRERHDEVIGVLGKLTARQFEKVEATATAAGIPNLRTYRVSDGQLDQLDQFIVAARPKRKATVKA